MRLNQLKAIQASLGDVNDCETVRAMLARWGGSKRIDNSIRNKERKRIREFRRQWRDEFADPEDLDAWLSDLQHFRRKSSTGQKGSARPS